MRKFITITGFLLIAVLIIGAAFPSVWVASVLRLGSGASFVTEPVTKASAATVTLGKGTFYSITGTTTITRLYTAPTDTLPIMQGRRITLYFNDTDSLLNGKNLILGSNFVGTVNDFIELTFYDSSWYKTNSAAN
jgi:hypothetical protein